MTIRQISVFVSNSAGCIADVVEVIGNCGADIRALSIADTTDFGILRLIADDPDKVAIALSEAGYVAAVNDVIAAYIEDRPGGLARALKPLARAGVAVEYAYAFVTRKDDNAYVVLRVEDNDYAAKVLRENGIKLASPDEVYKI